MQSGYEYPICVLGHSGGSKYKKRINWENGYTEATRQIVPLEA